MRERNREAPKDGLSYSLLYMLSMERCVQAYKPSTFFTSQSSMYLCQINAILKDFVIPNTEAKHCPVYKINLSLDLVLPSAALLEIYHWRTFWSFLAPDGWKCINLLTTFQAMLLITSITTKKFWYPTVGPNIMS